MKITNKKDLPKWFIERQYPPLETPAQWFLAISKRLAIRLFEPTSSEISLSMITDNDELDINKTIEDLEVNGGKSEIKYKNAVSNITAQDIIRYAALISDEKLNEVSNLKMAKNELESILNGNTDTDDDVHIRFPLILENFEKLHNPSYDKIAEENFEERFQEIKEGVCVVDLSLEESTLVSNFKNWVEIEKKKRGMETRQSKVPLSREILLDWNKYKILEVFDIDTWCRLTKTNVTDNALSKYLWPEDDIYSIDIDAITRLRQVTRAKKIKEIITFAMKSRLEGIIKVDLSEIKK